MSDVVVKYRPRSVSKVMVVIFVLLLFVPMLIALITFAVQLLHGEDGMRIGKFIKMLIFFGGVSAIVFRPASKITLDRQAGTLQHSTPWSTKAATQFPLAGLAAVTVEANPGGSLYRLMLTYRDGGRRPLTENFFYDQGHHQGVALALNAVIGAHVASAA
ncbi:MAG TPA: hypothetical protein VER96_14580 [Polyangiaceae bacterium]|nr:hypothetical protein [Polyangiaceae bacterium]